MASPFSFTRIDKTEMRDMDRWFTRPLYVINLLLDFITRFSNKGVTFTENIDCQFKEITFTTTSTYAAGDFTPLKFVKDTSSRAKAVQICQIQLSNNYLDSTLGGGDRHVVIGHWVEQDGRIIINYIGGLAADTKYFIRFIIF